MMLSLITLAWLAAGQGLPRWELSAAAAMGTPSVLPHGAGVGAALEVARRTGPVFVSGRLGWELASAANADWIIDHHQLVAALGVGLQRALGVGRVWAQIGAGASGLYEELSRHQRQRIDAAGVASGSRRSFALGPYGFAELGVAVRVRGPLGAFLAAGPALVRTEVEGAALWRAGPAARLGVVCEF
jgi:hypothetical protein